jgi:signal transduction histidine kinase
MLSSRSGPDGAVARKTMQSSSRITDRSIRRLYVGALALLLTLLLALVLGASVWSYRQVRREVDKELTQRLVSIGQAIAQGIGSRDIPVSSAVDSARVLLSIREELRRIADESDLGSIEIIDPGMRHIVGTLDTQTFGEPNLLYAAQPEVAVALAGIPSATPLYEAPEIPGAFFKTGFVAIENDSGRVMGVVAIEGGSDFFEILPALRRTWWIAGLASICIAAFLAVLLFGLFRALERYERGLRGTAALATAGQLAAVVAHEIRNPLAALLSRSERVREEVESGGDPERIARLLDAIPIEVRRLDRILSNYLSIARVSEGTSGCLVKPVIEETVDLVAKDLSHSRIEMSVTLPSRDVRVRLDPGPLKQALLNLILNAREAMQESGGRIEIRAFVDGDGVRIEVEDSGPGVPPRLHRKIFEPFFTTREGGSGLGLAVVESVARSCGGRIEVRSEPGSGSTFVLFLPVDIKDMKGDSDAAHGAVSDSARRG